MFVYERYISFINAVELLYNKELLVWHFVRIVLLKIDMYDKKLF